MSPSTTNPTVSFDTNVDGVFESLMPPLSNSASPPTSDISLGSNLSTKFTGVADEN